MGEELGSEYHFKNYAVSVIWQCTVKVKLSADHLAMVWWLILSDISCERYFQLFTEKASRSHGSSAKSNKTSWLWFWPWERVLPLPSPMYRTNTLIWPLEKSLILFIFNIVIKGPLLPGLVVKIDEMGNADMIVLQMLSQRFAYIIKSVNEDDEESGY